MQEESERFITLAEYTKLREERMKTVIRQCGQIVFQDPAFQKAIISSQIKGDEKNEINSHTAEKFFAPFQQWLDPVEFNKAKNTVSYLQQHLMLHQSSGEKSRPIYVVVLEKSENNNFFVNHEILQVLREKNIRKIFLFADAHSYNQSEITALKKIKEELHEKSFCVTAIVTPADAAWHISEKILHGFYVQCHEKTTNKKKQLLQGPSFLMIRQLFTRLDNSTSLPGFAFSRFEKEDPHIYVHSHAFHAHQAIHIMCECNPSFIQNTKRFCLCTTCRLVSFTTTQRDYCSQQ